MKNLNDPIPATTSTANEPDQLFHLAAAGKLQPADSIAPGSAAETDHPENNTTTRPNAVSDLPAFYYWKDAIVVGSYIHPAGRFSLDITRDRLDGLVSNFGRMKTNGVAVPILMDHAPTASATLGWIVDVKRDGDRLMELHQFLGEQSRDIGLRNKVSLGIDPHFVDGTGTHYGEAIVHSAVTPVPVVPNQGEFELASQPITLSLAAACETIVPIMPDKSDVDQIAAEQTAIPQHNSHDDVTTGDFHFAPQALEQVVVMKRDLALSRGAIDPAVADELFNLLVRPAQGSASTLLLSRGASGSSVAIAVFDALSRNRPAPLGEVTGMQVLSRSVPGEDGTLTDLRERMIALASGK